MRQSLKSFFRRRYIEPFRKFTGFIQLGTFGICFLMGYLLMEDSITKNGNPWIITGSAIFVVFFCFLVVEAIALFEFRGVELFDYGADRKSQLRDQWLGRFVTRALLLIGNGVLLYQFLKHW